ncbi:lycopene cyclase domain-containing protein [Cellulomonas bogoriensis]|uniref:C50 carotenoid epsilon cyclase n=1 Tax=Cellulomonas bogoriensis 69B4 = DSM 16987 TaxID=1386082 RepID=A0A0A0BT53_9CELL|nr:lycopene cyclase domain-containing protein [Cellulomonas bogoriensis]KGM11608.1 C50 carotenoid epsilon cyclase [Cellulomonas bogoriensis 69B4 = DSM 16987]
MSVAYGVALLISLTGMTVLDHRFRLFFFQDARRAAVVLVVGVLFFLAWDAVGIAQGVFFIGDTPYMTGLVLAPELPVEEVGFLTLLCYLTMNLYAAASRWVAGRPVDVRAARAKEDA